MTQAHIGLIGLAVMGQNLVMNMNDKGYTVAVYNRTASKVDDFLAGAAKGSNVQGAHTLSQFISLLERPRKVILMVRAGDAVDQFIDQLLPLLEPGDVIIDGGNSRYIDTERRCTTLAAREILFVGAGISGGEEGARHGPSIMPGGHPQAWPLIKDIFQSISAKSFDGEPCCRWVGNGGAGHYVKMVHNGIEYGDMQLICEAYHILKTALNLSQADLKQVFTDWNQGDLDSYLVEITATIFSHKEGGDPLVDKILDVAGQKGTGKWTGINALDLGVPVTLIGEAVNARYLSSYKEERIAASEAFSSPAPQATIAERETFIEQVRQALYASKIISYAQGFMLMREASQSYEWSLNYADIALLWQGGCIIRSRFLTEICRAFTENPKIKNLLLDPFFTKTVEEQEKAWRATVTMGLQAAIPLPCMTAALTFFDGYRSAWLPANLIQAQRDFFGAHTYERIDQPRGEFFHTNWTGHGGATVSSSYSA